jgi:carbon-monoxide dehydrogenase medium subunit
VIPRPFEYHAPAKLPEVFSLLDRYGDEAKLLAGGHSLLPMMKLRFAAPGHLIDLGKIDELKQIKQVGSEVHIGAMVTENELIWSEVVGQRLPLLVEGARLISDPQVRYKGTIGGDISHGDPGNDHPALMLALGASFVLRSTRGERVVPAQGYFVGLYETKIGPGEVLTQIRIPVPPAGTGWCYAKLKRKTGDFAAAATAVLLHLKGSAVDVVRIALTNVGSTPLRANAAEESLLGKPLNEPVIAEAARLAMGICEPVQDQRGDVEYKTAMAGEMTGRALRTALSRAG